MLRLLPKQVHIGLFGGQSWIKQARAPTCYRATGLGSSPSLIGVLEAILNEPTYAIPRGTRVALTVSDALASVIALPWQDRLRRTAELTRYAQICFERSGLTVDSSTLIHVEFRHFKASGLAYGLSRSFMIEAEDLCARRGLRLIRALPASAVAYAAFRSARADKCSAVLLCEDRRMTCLVFGRSGLRGYEVEPLSFNEGNVARRLLRRVRALYGAPSHLAHWTSFTSNQADLTQAIGDELPETELRVLSMDAFVR